jgi:hypothetical protein
VVKIAVMTRRPKTVRAETPAPETPPPEINEAHGKCSRGLAKELKQAYEEILAGDIPPRFTALLDMLSGESNSENTTGNKLELCYNPPAAIPQPAPELPAPMLGRQDENSLLDVNDERARLAQFIAFDATAEQLAKVARVLTPEKEQSAERVYTTAVGYEFKVKRLPVKELNEEQHLKRKEPEGAAIEGMGIGGAGTGEKDAKSRPRFRLNVRVRIIPSLPAWGAGAGRLSMRAAAVLLLSKLRRLSSTCRAAFHLALAASSAAQ